MKPAGKAEALYQYTAIAQKGRAFLIEGPPGCGKTSLALALIDRGAMLIGDDGVRLENCGGQIIAHPPSQTRGKIEVRNVGLCDVPCTSAAVALILAITPGAPRFIEHAGTFALLGVAIPCLDFATGSPADAIRAEYAMVRHGLMIPNAPV